MTAGASCGTGIPAPPDDLKVKVTGDAATTPTPTTWLCPLRHRPPIGKKLQLLAYGGSATYGHWRWDGGFIAWAPFAQIPPEIKARIGHLPNWQKLLNMGAAETAAPE